MKYKQPQLAVPINEPDFTCANHIMLLFTVISFVKVMVWNAKVIGLLSKNRSKFCVCL